MSPVWSALVAFAIGISPLYTSNPVRVTVDRAHAVVVQAPAGARAADFPARVMALEAAVANAPDDAARATLGAQLADARVAWAVALRESYAYDEAIAQFLAAYASDHTARPRKGVTQLVEIGRTHCTVSRYEAAAAYAKRALEAARAGGWKREEGLALDLLGEVLLLTGRAGEAVEVLEGAAGLMRESGDASGEVNALKNVARARLYGGSTQAALDVLAKALVLAREVGDRMGEGALLHYLGLAAANLSESEKAISYYEQALAIRREAGDRHGEGLTLNNLGASYEVLSQYEKAIRYYEEALAIRREIRDRRGEGLTLNNLGVAFDNLGQYEKAIDYSEQALAIRREVGDRLGESDALNSLGRAYRHLSKYEKAIDHYERALAIRRDVEDRRGEGDTLNNLGVAYSDLSQFERAIAYYTLALTIRRELGDRAGEADTLNSLGIVYNDLNEYEKAIGCYEQSLAIRREIKDRRGEGLVLNNLGSIYNDLSWYTKAIGCYEQALAIRREVKDRSGEGLTYNNLGNSHYYLNQYDDAIGYYEKALAIRREVKDRRGEGTTLHNLMLVWKQEARPELAIFFGKLAVNCVQDIRGNIRGLDAELQKSYIGSNEATYRILADLLISRGRLAEAEQVLSLLKDQELENFVRGEGDTARASRHLDLTPEEAKLAERDAALTKQLVDLGQLYDALLAKSSLSADEERQIADVFARLQANQRDFKAFLDSLPTELGRAAQTAGSVENLKASLSIQQTLRDLGPGTVALYTLAGEDRLRVVFVSANFSRAFEYPIAAKELDTKIAAFRQALQNRTSDPRPAARELYQIVLGQVAPLLEQYGAKTLMWSLDGNLRYLPVGALYDGERYLVERYASCVFTLARRDALLRAPSGSWRVAGFGVSVPPAGTDFTPLKHVPTELTGIVRDAAKADTTGVLPGIRRLDGEFTRSALTLALARKYPVLHIATHFRFNPGDYTQSYLLLGDGQLSIQSIRDEASFEGVDLLTLSACETAMGGGGANGREVESFGMIAQDRGANAVLATLWPVDDASTEKLMTRFYRVREAGGMTKLEALRQAQLELLRGGGTAGGDSAEHRGTGKIAKNDTGQFKPDPAAPYAHPYYWAPFILIGNWK
jgi:CHAT domain-containing protein/Tfp pilus assembly protein PilF